MGRDISAADALNANATVATDERSQVLAFIFYPQTGHKIGPNAQTFIKLYRRIDDVCSFLVTVEENLICYDYQSLRDYSESPDRCLSGPSSILDCNITALRHMGRIARLANGSQKMEKAAEAAYFIDIIR
jgi:hypothetical protein